VSADLEVMLKKHPSRVLELANSESLIIASRSHDSVDFANIVKLSEAQSPEHDEPDG